jgi:hypothetical protein
MLRNSSKWSKFLETVCKIDSKVTKFVKETWRKDRSKHANSIIERSKAILDRDQRKHKIGTKNCKYSKYQVIYIDQS